MNNKSINSKLDSNAISLDIRNFGMLPPTLTRSWMIEFASIKEGKIKHPTKAIIELVNSCNFDCQMCRVGQYGVDLSRVMSLNDFVKIISEIDGLEIVRLNGLGESTILSNVQDYLNFLFEKQIKVEIITNGSGRNEIYKDILKHSGSVIFSWDAAEKELFEKLRSRAKWDVLVDKIKKINDDMKKSGNKRISFLFTLQKENVGHLSKIVGVSHDLGVDKIILNVVKDDDFHWMDDEVIEKIKKDLDHAVELAKKYGIELLYPTVRLDNKIIFHGKFNSCQDFCSMSWSEVVIRWNGDIQPCNMFNPYVYGNVFLNSFDDIWNGLFVMLFRKMINTNRRHPYCRNCVYFEEAYEKL